MKNTRIFILNLLATAILLTGNIRATAQFYTDPGEIPTAGLTDCAPVFNAIDDNFFSAEISSRQQYMEIKGHPSSYRLSVTGSPKAFHTKSGRFVLHGEARERNHGFQRNAYLGLGAASILRLAGGHHLYADLHYEFGYKWYNLQDVVTENPAYASAAEPSYTHLPTFCLGYGYHGAEWKAGFALSANAVLPGESRVKDRYFAIGATGYGQSSFGRKWKKEQSLGDVRVFLNGIRYSLPGAEYAVTAGFDIRIACLYLGTFYRHAAGWEYPGVSAGIDLGRMLNLFYRVAFPLRPGNVTAGVAAHEFGLRFSMPRNEERKEKNKTSEEDDDDL